MPGDPDSGAEDELTVDAAAAEEIARAYAFGDGAPPQEKENKKERERDRERDFESPATERGEKRE